MNYDEFMQSARSVRETRIEGATPGCRLNGCQAPELAMLARRVSGQQHEVLETLTRKETQMEPTKALWCEQGGHSFSEKDPDLQVLTIAGRGPDGKTVEESRTICGACAEKTKTRIGGAQNSPVSSLPSGDEIQR